ncbi:MAG TPA: riboflavin kinase, partial [Methyloceanibacter sp.]
GGDKPVLEAYIFDFEGDLYNEEIEVEFIEKLRHDEAFADGEALAAQMRHDCAQVRGLLTMLAGGDPMARYRLGRALSGGTGL